MSIIKATVHGGRLELDVPSDWPDGIEVEIHPVGTAVTDDVDAMSPEQIGIVLSAMDKVHAFDLSDAERIAWDAERQAAKQSDKAVFVPHAENLRGMWE